MKTNKITYEQIKKSPEVNAYIQQGNASLQTQGYTDHSSIHASIVSKQAARILQKLGYDNRTVELARIAGYMHDRVNYAVTGAALHIRPQKEQIQFSIQLDESICSMMDYFEIFLQRMLMCKRSAEVLHMRFKMTANGNKIC